MKVELRIFKHAKFVLLLSETEEESKVLDHLFHSNSPHSETKLDATVTTDDSFNPYIRVRV